MMKHLVLLGLAGCVAPTVTTSVSPLTAGAPNDGISDRVWLQAQIDAAAAAPDGGTVLIPAGRWTLDRAPVGSGAYNTHAALATHGRNVTIRGVGPETVLELAGDQGAQSVALISIDPSAEHIRIADLTLDLSASVNTDEQTHAIATSGVCAGATCQPIRDVTVDHVTFRHPRNTVSRKGDCVRLLGNSEATKLVGVRIVGNDFADCARSAVMIQRGVTDVTIAGNTMSAVKTCIDGEATGAGLDERIAITGNVLRPGCSPAVSLTNFAGGIVSGNAIAGAVTVYRSTGVAITGNAIAHVAADNSATIDVANLCDGLSVTGNTITRSGAAGPVVKLVPHSGVACQRVAITGNAIAQLGVAGGIQLESVSNVSITGNQLTFVGAPAYSAIYELSVLATPVTGVVIAHNLISGPLTYGVQLHAHPGTFGAGVSVTGNVATGTTFGLYLNNAPGFAVPVTSSGNAMGGGVYSAGAVLPGD